MKKIILAIALIVGANTNVSAQKWLKSVGKALEKAEKVLSTADGGSNNSSTRSSSSDNSSAKEEKRNMESKADYTIEEVKAIDNSAVGTPIDLGLSVKWSTRNLGAAQPFQTGGYYDYQSDWLGKYWGDDWDIPTLADWEELQTKCDIKYISVQLKSMPGQEHPKYAGYFIITGPNGNRMWLPTAGYKSSMTSDYLTDEQIVSEGYYWTSEPHTKHQVWGECAHWLFIQDTFDTPVPKHYAETKTLRCASSIRPVYRKKARQQSSATANQEKIFKGKWANKEGRAVLELDLYDKSIEWENGKCYGVLGMVVGRGFDMDNDVITSVKINGNEAIVEYNCERMEDAGKASLTYNPKTKEMTIKPLKAPGEGEAPYCFLTDITLPKTK